MPKAFTDCIKNGGRVRTKSLPNNQYIHICFPKGGGSSISGEMKTAQKKHKKLTIKMSKKKFKQLTDAL